MSATGERKAIAGCMTTTAKGVVVDVKVQPRARRNAVEGVHGSSLKVKVTASPTDGRANEAVVDLLAATLSMKRGRLSLVSGASSRHKRVLVEGAAAADVVDRLSEQLGS